MADSQSAWERDPSQGYSGWRYGRRVLFQEFPQLEVQSPDVFTGDFLAWRDPERTLGLTVASKNTAASGTTLVGDAAMQWESNYHGEVVFRLEAVSPIAGIANFWLAQSAPSVTYILLRQFTGTLNATQRVKVQPGTRYTFSAQAGDNLASQFSARMQVLSAEGARRRARDTSTVVCTTAPLADTTLLQTPCKGAPMFLEVCV